MSFNIQNTQPSLSFPLGMSVQRGLVQGFTGIQKFGYNTAVGSSLETIWDNNANYVYVSSAGTATVTSSDTASDNNGTVEIQGLDGDYNLVTATATIGGSATTETFLRIFRMRMTSANTGSANVGTITATVGSTGLAIIRPTYGQTLMAVYTVPANKRAYLMSVNGGSRKDVENEIAIFTKKSDEDVFNIKSFFSFRGEFAKRDFIVPEIFTEKTDIELRASSSATNSISGGFDLFLEDI